MANYFKQAAKGAEDVGRGLKKVGSAVGNWAGKNIGGPAIRGAEGVGERITGMTGRQGGYGKYVGPSITSKMGPGIPMKKWAQMEALKGASKAKPKPFGVSPSRKYGKPV